MFTDGTESQEKPTVLTLDRVVTFRCTKMEKVVCFKRTKKTHDSRYSTLRAEVPFRLSMFTESFTFDERLFVLAFTLLFFVLQTRVQRTAQDKSQNKKPICTAKVKGEQSSKDEKEPLLAVYSL